MAKTTLTPVDKIHQSFVNLKEYFDVSIDKEYVEEVYEARKQNEYQTKKEIYLTIIKLADGEYNLLMAMYYRLAMLAKENNEEWFEYFKLNAYYHAKKSIESSKNMLLEQKLIILVKETYCGNCAHLGNKYIELDTQFEDFPIPVKECSRGICGASAIAYSVRGIDKHGYRPYIKKI